MPIRTMPVFVRDVVHIWIDRAGFTRLAAFMPARRRPSGPPAPGPNLCNIIIILNIIVCNSIILITITISISITISIIIIIIITNIINIINIININNIIIVLPHPNTVWGLLPG